MFKPSLLSTAIATALAAMSQGLVAQEAETGDDSEEAVVQEQIVITGIRASMAKAVDIKRNKIQVTESIVAEDIGKFPDNNVIEALQRLPGVQVTNRDRGEVGTLTVRGLTDITTTVNGRQMYISNGRFYTLADTPASLISQVDVYKTRSADMVPSGIAGQIDIKTQRPFNFDGSKIVLAARGIYSDQEGTVDPTIGALFSNRWETGLGDFGALLNVSMTETNWRDQSITSGAAFPYFTSSPEGEGLDRFGNSGEFLPFDRINSAYWEQGLELGLPFQPGSTLNTNGYENEYILSRDAVFASDLSGERERPAANLSLQFSPNDTSEYLFEAFYNGYRERVRNSLFFTFPDSYWNLDFNDDIVLYEGTNIVKERRVYDGDPRHGVWETDFNSTDVDVRKTDTYMFALGGKWNFTDSFELKAELVNQQSTFESDFFAIRLLHDYYSAWVDFNHGSGVAAMEFYDNPATPGVDESDLLDPAQYRMGPAWDNGLRDKGESNALYLDADWQLDFAGISELSFGLLYEVRDTSSEGRGANILSFDGNTSVAAQPEAFYDSTSDFYDGRAHFPSGWFIGNVDYMVSNKDYFRELYGFYDENGQPVDNYLTGGNSLILRPTFEAEETTTDAYVQATFEYEVPGGVLDGTVGLRYTDSEIPIDFYRVTEGTVVTDLGENTSTEVLPSLVARYNFMDDYVLRLAYTETIRRPDFGALNPFTTYAQGVTSVGAGFANSGNPDLEPTISSNLDLSFEYYFSEGNMAYATLFRREIEGLVVSSRTRVMYDDPDDDPDMGEQIYVLTQPDNSANGELDGIEVGVVYFPENLPGILDGFGVQASYTALDSSQDIPFYDNDTGNLLGYDTVELFGVSDSSYSIVLAYDKEPFGARLSYVWRDAFRYDNEAAVFANPLPRYRAAETSLDFQMNWDINDSFTVTFDATNLTDEQFQAYYQYPDIYNFSSGIYSKTYALGVRFSY